MCGIAGILVPRTSDLREDARRSLRAMLDIQAHRGPDGEGMWSSAVAETGILLGHKRLAIIDLTAGGAQPIVSPCGQYVLVYNGELYNYLELRAVLEAEAVTFRSRSDTEVVLQALIRWGSRAFEKFNGMWALAFVDLRSEAVLLSRDRFGEKPLYYYEGDQGLYFASEIKALLKGCKDRHTINRSVVFRFLEQSLLESQDETFFTCIQKVPAAHSIRIPLTGTDALKPEKPQAYWTYPDSSLDLMNGQDLEPRIRDTFLDAVKIRLRSDVPYAVLLSGGVDSSSIAAAVHAEGSGAKPLALAVVSDDPETSEEPFIDKMVEHLGWPCYKLRLRLKPEEGMECLQRATWFNDEPVGGFSYAAHLMLMEKARELGVTVLLSGQGGDELLCGYTKYYGFYLQWLFRERSFAELTSELWSLLRTHDGWLRGVKLPEARRYIPLRGRWFSPGIINTDPGDTSWRQDIGLSHASVQARQVRDLRQFSVPALTHYEDRMSMAASREIRLPFLDHRMAELLLPLPVHLKLNSGWTKWIFRKAMVPLLPQEIAWRMDKKGFTTPLARWLRHEWQGFLRGFFNGDLVTAEMGLINKARLIQLYGSYCAGRNPWIGVKDVFNALALELWARQYQQYLV